MKNAIDKLVRAAEAACTILMILIALFVFLQILARDVLRVSLPWTEEGARYLQVTMVMLGAAVCLRRDVMVKLDLSFSLGRAADRALGVVAESAALVCALVYGAGSLVMIGLNWHIPTVSLEPVTVGWLYLVAAAGWLLVAAVAVLRITEMFLKRRG